MQPSPEELHLRLKWFEWYVEQVSKSSAYLPLDGQGPYQCPCCGCKTLAERGGFEVCPVCYWEDDGQDDHDADLVRGGPNGALSLTQARANYRALGACEDRFVDKVRRPLPDESP